MWRSACVNNSRSRMVCLELIVGTNLDRLTGAAHREAMAAQTLRWRADHQHRSCARWVRRAHTKVRRFPQEPPRTRGSRRDQARKNPNRERLGFCYWWWNTEPNPRPLSEPDSNTLALRAWIRRFGHRHCSESKSNSSQSLPDQRKPSSSGMADVPFGRIEKCRLFPVVLSDQVAWQVPHWQ